MTLAITLVTGVESEARTRDLLCDLLARYDLSRWQCTDHIQIAHRAIPHSHPILTINTAERESARLLAVYLHEQLHWYTLTQPAGQDAVGSQMRSRYPDLPVRLPEGCGSEHGNQIHLLICPLEFMALIALLGEESARQVMASHRVYTAIYDLVLRDYEMIHRLFVQHNYGP